MNNGGAVELDRANQQLEAAEGKLEPPPPASLPLATTHSPSPPDILVESVLPLVPHWLQLQIVPLPSPVPSVLPGRAG
eukprot:CAMPEP_0196756326 /NCGR_PEP_ID=MMETSP1091-20130531/100587_1 /TAXON_ID=302021 /ORGANISM="Rhodomonas sp., Strain CCMP768" /LENGTH=77 /DNA_ID=CAMNT_0042104913 /DNA_START=227 /DNA_END=460 /DNA_ORIENTATION=+